MRKTPPITDSQPKMVMMTGQPATQTLWVEHDGEAAEQRQDAGEKDETAVLEEIGGHLAHVVLIDQHGGADGQQNGPISLARNSDVSMKSSPNAHYDFARGSVDPDPRGDKVRLSAFLSRSGG